MLIEEDFLVSITTRNIEFYNNLGYAVNIKDKITVKSSHLTPYNKNKVKVKCDYCNKVFERRFQDHYKNINKKFLAEKDACKNCRGQKSKDITRLFLNGVPPSQSEVAIKKRKSTNIERYGVDNPMKSKEIYNKAKRTISDIYGVDNIFKYEKFYDMRVNSMIEKYGYISVFSIPERKEEIIAKRNYTLYEKHNAPCSTQQKYIHDVVGGELNYPVDTLLLDIAFLEDFTYLEYQGSGHNLDVKLEKITQKDFNKKEMNRYYYLKNKGWKMIEIVSRKDYIPKKSKLLEMINFSKVILKETSFVQFDIDNKTIKYNKKLHPYDFGELISYSQLHRSINKNNYSKLLY